MFIGHYAVAMAAKKAAPKTSLGTLFLASQLVDLIWPILLILGVEHVRVNQGNTVVTPLDFYDYPITHSLVGVISWAVVMGLFYLYIRRDIKASSVIALCVISHWILDYITHKPDLPLNPGSDKLYGLGLWNSLSGTLIVEVGLYVIGIALYINSTKAKDKTGNYAFWSLIIVLLLIYAGNIFGGAPPGETVIGYLGLTGWLVILWAYWIDTHRVNLE
jgi:hypothetical protein